MVDKLQPQTKPDPECGQSEPIDWDEMDRETAWDIAKVLLATIVLMLLMFWLDPR